jgi:alpha/beta superfamily hydrolase
MDPHSRQLDPGEPGGHSPDKQSRRLGQAVSVVAIDNLYGPDGRLEAVLNTGHDDARYAALLCHPYPPAGGTMHNKVVYNAMKVFSGLGLPVLRFNFRGVGLSEGTFDHGHGEVDDARAALSWLEHHYKRPILLGGFSFGANVALRAGCGDLRVEGLVGLGLPIRAEGRDYTYDFLPQCAMPKLFISGDQDPFAPRRAVEEVLSHATPPTQAIWIEGAEHFFQGVPESPEPKLHRMRAELDRWLRQTFGLGD